MRASTPLLTLLLAGPAVAATSVTAEVITPRVVAGGTFIVRIDPDQLAPGDRVGLLGARQQGVGPCGPTGACLALAPPATVLDQRRPASAQPYLVDLQLPAGLVGGTTVYLQAGVRGAAGIAAVSDVLEVFIEVPAPGCTDPTADNYDPAFNVDDGSCRCQDQVTVSTAAALAQHAACTELGDLVLLDYQDATVDLPVLQAATTVHVRGASSALTTLRAPALASLSWLDLRDAPALATVDLPALTALDGLVVDGAAPVGFWPVPALQAVGLYEAHGVTASTMQLPVRPWDIAAVDVASGLATLSLPLGPDAPLVVVSGDTAPDLQIDAGGALFGVDLNVVSATNVVVSGATDLVTLSVLGNPSLAQLDLPATASVVELTVVDNPALVGLAMPNLVTVDALQIGTNPVLADVDLPVLGAVTSFGGLFDNPAWCVTNVPFFGGLAPGGNVVTERNLCNL